MPYPFHILQNEKLPASSQDVETFIRHALGQHHFIVERENLDQTNKRFRLDFWHRDIPLDRYMPDGKIGKTYWGGAEIIEWSNSTEIVRMWPATPENWYLGEFNLDRDKVMEERFGWLEELSNEIREQFIKTTSVQEMPVPNNSEDNGKDIKRNVFVVHGRNEALRRSVFDFLRAIGLNPIEWSKAISMTGKGSPFIGEVLDKAMEQAQAIIVLLSGDDLAKLRDEFIKENDPEYEKNLTPQARPNVLFEAGFAFGKFPDQTILIQIGDIRPFSDITGRHVIRLDNTVPTRQDLGQRLAKAGCNVDLSGTDWHTVGEFRSNVILKPNQTKKNTEINENKLPDFPSDEILKAISANHQIEIDEIKTLFIIGTAHEFEPGTASVTLIGRFLDLNPIRVEHYCSELNEHGFVYVSAHGGREGTVYKIGTKGRSFLVDQKLI